MAALLLMLGAGGVHAQTGVDHYLRGDYPAAAAAFRSGVDRLPEPVRLYDLAAAEYMSRRDAQAVAALLSARERAPRNRHAEALWKPLAREHEQLRRIGSRLPVSAEELLGGALVLLWIGALLFIVFRRQARALDGGIGSLRGCRRVGHRARRERGCRARCWRVAPSLRSSPTDWRRSGGRYPCSAWSDLSGSMAIGG